MILHLRAAVQQLYAVVPGAFVAERARLVAEAKAAGEKSLAREIGALRRPTVAAWAVNHFVRTHPDEIDELRSFAELLREAQRTLDADQLRLLGRERARRVDALTDRIAAVSAEAGQPVGPGVADEVRATLTALIADEDAEASVLTGALVRALSYSGFGSVDIEDVVAWNELAGRRPALAVVRGEADESGDAGSEDDERERAAAEAAEAAERAARRAAARTALTAALDGARRATRAADRQVAVLTARQEEVTEGIADLERQLATARERLAKVTAELTEASGIRDAREAEEEAADAALRDLGSEGAD